MSDDDKGLILRCRMRFTVDPKDHFTMVYHPRDYGDGDVGWWSHAKNRPCQQCADEPVRPDALTDRIRKCAELFYDTEAPEDRRFVVWNLFSQVPGRGKTPEEAIADMRRRTAAFSDGSKLDKRATLE